MLITVPVREKHHLVTQRNKTIKRAALKGDEMQLAKKLLWSWWHLGEIVTQYTRPTLDWQPNPSLMGAGPRSPSRAGRRRDNKYSCTTLIAVSAAIRHRANSSGLNDDESIDH